MRCCESVKLYCIIMEMEILQMIFFYLFTNCCYILVYKIVGKNGVISFSELHEAFT